MTGKKIGQTLVIAAAVFAAANHETSAIGIVAAILVAGSWISDAIRAKP